MKSDQALPLGYVLVHGEKQYIIQRVLGTGGFGITYRVKCRINNIPVTFAIKELFMSKLCWRDSTHAVSYSPGATDDINKAIRNFVTEASRLNDNGFRHSNIVSISDVFCANNTAYYVMEYIEGETLMTSIRDSRGGRPYELDAALAIMRPVLDALDALHAHRLTHLDIKPENILLDSDVVGNEIRPVIIDFGLSKHYDANGDATSTLLSSGCSAGYAPIEQYDTLPCFTPQADVYAAAATLYTLLTARRPATAFALKLNDIEKDLRDNNVPERVVAAIRRAMAKMYEQRTPTIAEFAADLGLTEYKSSDNNTLPVGNVRSTDNKLVADLGAPDSATHDTLNTPAAKEPTIKINSTSNKINSTSKLRISRLKPTIGAAIAVISALLLIGISTLFYNKLNTPTLATHADSVTRKSQFSNEFDSTVIANNSDSLQVDSQTDDWSMFQDPNTGKYGFVDSYGTIAIEPIFDPTDGHYCFSEGLAAVSIGGKYGYINPSGEFVIKPQFFNAEDFSEGLAAVYIGEKYGYINKSGQFAIKPRFDEARSFSEGLAAVQSEGKWGFINKSGQFVIEPQLDYAISFSEGLAEVESEDRWGYINKSGQFVIEPQYNNTRPFSEGLAAVYIGEKYGYIDKSGKFVIKPQFYTALDFSEGLAAVCVGEKYGYIDKSGRFVIKPRFYDAENFKKGLAEVQLGEDYGYVDKSGHFYNAYNHGQARRMMEEAQNKEAKSVIAQ